MPALGLARELVDEHERDALADLLVVEPDPVDENSRHGPSRGQTLISKRFGQRPRGTERGRASGPGFDVDLFTVAPRRFGNCPEVKV
jgi:hypothetical protein